MILVCAVWMVCVAVEAGKGKARKFNVMLVLIRVIVLYSVTLSQQPQPFDSFVRSRLRRDG